MNCNMPHFSSKLITDEFDRFTYCKANVAKTLTLNKQGWAQGKKKNPEVKL